VDIATYVASGESQFDAGETLYVYSYDNGGADDPIYYVSGKANVTTNANDVDVNIADSGATANLKIIDVASQQLISDMSVRF
jgi:hypothetical protein